MVPCPAASQTSFPSLTPASPLNPTTMVQVAELLADLTLLKTIVPLPLPLPIISLTAHHQNSTEALSLVSATTTTTADSDADPDFKRAMEFLALRSEQIQHDELTEKRRAVAKVIARINGEEEEEAAVEESSEESQSSGQVGRMAGAWRRSP